jgi:hypothetical protein
VERRQGALFSCVLLCRACEARRSALAAIFGRGPTLSSPAMGHRSRSDCPRQAVNALAVGVRTSHGAVRAVAAGRHTWLRLQVVSGDAPS